MDFDVDDVGALCLAHSLQVHTYSFIEVVYLVGKFIHFGIRKITFNT